jgi:hypothetical protein
MGFQSTVNVSSTVKNCHVMNCNSTFRFQQQEAGRNCVLQEFMMCTLDHKYLGDLIKGGEMGRSCGTYGRGEKCVHGFGGEASGKGTVWKM